MNQGDEKEMNARERLLAAPLTDLDSPSLIQDLYYMIDRQGELYRHDRIFYVQDNKEETDRRVARALERAPRPEEAAAVIAYAIVEVRFLEGDEPDIPSTRRLFGAMRGVAYAIVEVRFLEGDEPDIPSTRRLFGAARGVRGMRWAKGHPWMFLWGYVSGLWRASANIPLYGSEPSRWG
jgi:hypothetical protein